MTLPDITAYIPKIVLPFDVPVLLHPLVVHFMIAVPVIVLLLELTNLIMKKKAVGVVSFALLLLTVLAATGAYFTGLVDGKEAYDVLSDAAKTELSEHKLLGTYLLLASVIVLFFKLVSSAMNSGIMKALYILLLIAFVLGIFQQGKEGGELVYEHGMNVAQVKTLDDKIFDLEEELEEAKEEIAESTKKVEEEVVPQVAIPAVIKEKTPEETTPVEAIDDTTQVTQQAVEEVKAEVKTESLPYTEPVQVEPMPEAVPQVQIPTH